MSRQKALVRYLQLRARRERLAKLQPDRNGKVSDQFTDEELAQFRLAERELNAIRGAAAIELLIENRSSVFGFLKG